MMLTDTGHKNIHAYHNDHTELWNKHEVEQMNKAIQLIRRKLAHVNWSVWKFLMTIFSLQQDPNSKDKDHITKPWPSPYRIPF